MPNRPTRLHWNTSRILKIVNRNKIRDRSHMADIIGLGRTTVYQTFDEDWGGTATMSVLTRMADTFNVRVFDLIVEPTAARRNAENPDKQLAVAGLAARP